MTVVGVLLVAAGAYLCYYAVRNKAAGKPGTGPLTNATKTLSVLTGKSKTTVRTTGEIAV